jgi:WD40 repeat protein
MYTYIRHPNATGKNRNPLNVTTMATTHTQKQIKEYVFCSDCEGLFDKNGENSTLRLVWNGNRFPLGEKLSLGLAHSQFGSIVAFSGKAMGINTDALGYFALSVIWRGAVHQWNLPSGKKSVLLNLGAAEDTIRDYLRGNTPFPIDVVVLAAACTDTPSQRIFHLPSQTSNPLFASFNLLTLGIQFWVFAGSGIPPLLREQCCVRSVANLIFQLDCSAKTLETYKQIVSKRPITPI